MTSQRDETASRPPGEHVADDPIIIERRDEILTGEEPAPAATGEDGEGGPASDELVGRHVVPDSGGMDPAPLVIPADSASPESASPESASPESASPGVGPLGTGAPGSDSPTAYDPATSGPAAMPGSEAPGPGPFAMPVSGQADPPPAATPSPAVTVAEPGVAEPSALGPGVTGIPEPDVSGPAGAGDGGVAAGATGPGIPAAALSEQQWPAIQAMFVDDPKGSVQRAAAAADEVMKSFVASIEREQAALRTAWESDATTEDLRTALQQYRAFCGRLEGLA